MSYEPEKPKSLSADPQFILYQFRQRLAEILHDGPLQDLIGAQLELKALMKAGGDSEEQLAPIAAGIEAALTELRRVIQDKK